jgi:hypothetical protein
MGLNGYCKRFIEGFSKISHPITSLQKKGLNFEWHVKCEENLQCLNDLLTSEPILKVVYPYKNFVVCTDACKEGIRRFLMKNGHVTFYKFTKLKEHEINYATHDLELETIVHALRMWRHYLMGRKYELRRDHSGLKYVFEHPTLNAIQTRWMEFLSEYNFYIKNIEGKENKVVDALSRRVHKMHTTTISMHRTYLKDRIIEVV